MKGKHPYAECPVYTTAHFLVRLVEKEDGEDLLRCYSDPSAVRLMNADNCDTDFHFETLDAMNDYLKGWLNAYQASAFVRFAIIDSQHEQAIGTIEMYDKTRKLGILRLDLCSTYERQEYIRELLQLAIENFYKAFGVQQIAIKAILAAAERISALRECGFAPAERHVNGPYGDYYLR